MKHLTWLWGAVGVSALLALATDQVLKALQNHAEATLLNHEVRGGIVGVVAGVALGKLGTPSAKRSVTGWREKVFAAATKKK
jgi:hypothetical protein